MRNRNSSPPRANRDPNAFARFSAWLQRASQWRLAPMLVAILALLPSLGFPLHNDATIFVQGGAGLWDGFALYRDFWDIKPPSIYLVNALPGALSPAGWGFGFYALNMVVVALGTQGLAVLARRLSGQRAVWPAVLVSLLAFLVSGAQALGQCETWSTTLIVGALLIWTRDGRLGVAHAVGVGVLAALIVSFKPTSLLPLLPLLLLAKRPKSAWLWAISGGISLGILMILVMRWSGIWPAYLDIQRGFVVPYVAHSRATLVERVLRTASALHFWVVILWLPVLLAGAAVLKPNRTRAILGAALLVGAGALWIQNHLFHYQWQVMLLPLALLAGAGAARLLEPPDPFVDEASGAPRRPLFAGLNLPRFIVPALVASWALQETGTWFQVGLYAARVADRSPDAPRDFDFVESRDVEPIPTRHERRIAHFIRDHSRADETIWVWIYAPAIYIEAQRRAPGRFFHHPALVVPYSPRAWQNETWRVLQTRPPRFIVVGHGDIMREFGVPMGVDSAQLWRKTPIYAWFNRNYRQVKRDGSYHLWEFQPRFDENSSNSAP